MLIPTVSIVTNFVLNNTDIEWFEFQDYVQEGLKTSLHCLPKHKMGILLSSRQHEKYPELYFEVWGCVRDYQLDIAIIKALTTAEERIKGLDQISQSIKEKRE